MRSDRTRSDDAGPDGSRTAQGEPARARYGTPALREYGAVARRTMNSSLAGMFDSVNPATMLMV
ncbi:MAG: hypothetical protein L6R43_09780 [Planctomycetes bacterium]|nr:hypothetical protein [Planctomycetota bacterium]